MDKLLENYIQRKNTESVKYEFELRFKHYNDSLTRSDYNNVIEWLLMCGFKIKEKLSLFRISIGKNIRAEIDGIENIKKYCNLQEVDLNYVEKQKLDEPYVNTKYNVQFSLNSETTLSTTDIHSDNNTYRFMKRIQLQHPDHPSFVVDCSIVKMLRNSSYKLMGEVFNRTPTYEVEVEFINPLPKKECISEIQFAITSVLKGLQRTNFPISYTEINEVQTEYKQLFPVKDTYFNFIGPNTITLQHDHISMLNEDNFMVTDKADGERKLLFITKDMKLYLITTTGKVENMNCTLKPQKGMPIGPIVLDGEHVVKDKHAQYHNTFYAFDIYYLNTLPMTEENKKQLKISENDIRANDLLIRRDLLIRIVNNVFPNHVNLAENKYAIQYKTFLPFSNTHCKMLYENETPYHKDGLIFTPIHYGVGLTSENKVVSNKRITWDLNFKWKPAEENTIDFYVDIQDDVKTTLSGKKYKTITLKSSYNSYPSKFQTDYTACASVSVYQNFDVISNGKQKIPFIGGQPYDVTAYICNCYTNEEGNICTEGQSVEVIEQGSIVEFKYDTTKEDTWKWVPIRIRWDKTDPNAYTTAVKNWITIHNPVTFDMLSSEKQSKEYYTLKTDVDKKEYKIIRDFHNDIKRIMLEKVANQHRKKNHFNPMLMDFAVGKGGDLQKWDDANYSFVLGVDITNDNLHNNVDGAFMRVVQSKIRKFKTRDKHVMPIIFVEGDSRLLIKTGESIKHDYEYKILQYLFGMETTAPPMLSEQTKIPYGLCKKGFDVGSIQFALHYMFETEVSLYTFVYNLMDCIKVGGYFCATCFDGDSIFELLSKYNKNQIISTYHDELGPFKLSTDLPEDYVPFASIQKLYDKKIIDKSKFVQLPIGIKQQTLNKDKFLTEYLVFADYFIRVMKDHGFELATDINEFPNGTGLFNSIDSKYKDMSKDRNQETISYLNRYYIFQKTKNITFRSVKLYDIDKKEYIKVVIN
jgi:hypothetical protein